MAEAPVQVGPALTAHAANTRTTELVAQSPRPLLPTIHSCPSPPQSLKTYIRCQKRLWDQRLDTAVKNFGILAFLLSCAALYPSICGQEDAHRATQLA